MYGFEWLIVCAVLGLVVGASLGLLVARRSDRPTARSRKLEAELAAAREEHSRYKQSVVDQFSETARRFKTLNESYGALHRQLAESASMLCGNAAGPLLEAPERTAQAPLEDQSATASGTATASDTAATEGATTQGAQPEAASTEESSTAGLSTEARNTDDEIVLQEPQPEATAPAEPAAERSERKAAG
ncbi:MAG: DUF1043 family protein [Pseudomonadales bacterium]